MDQVGDDGQTGGFSEPFCQRRAIDVKSTGQFLDRDSSLIMRVQVQYDVSDIARGLSISSHVEDIDVVVRQALARSGFHIRLQG